MPPDGTRSCPRREAEPLAHAPNTTDYELRPSDLSPKGIERIASLLRTVFPAARHLSPAYLAWQYTRNPAGAAIAHDAFLDGALVGHYATLPGPLRLFGEPALGVLIVNLAVLPGHQGRGVMTELGLRSFERAREQGVACAWGVANANSTHGHARTFGFQHVLALDARFGVGPLPTPRPGADADFERVWDEAALRWRLENPSARYALAEVGGRCEIQADAGIPGVRAVLGTTHAPPRDVRAGSALRPRVWIGVDPALRWRRRAYLDVPVRLRPSPLNVVFKDLRGERTLDPARLRIHGIDFDAY